VLLIWELRFPNIQENNMAYEVRSKTGGAVPGLGAWAETTGNEAWKTMAATHEEGIAAGAGYAPPVDDELFNEMVRAFVDANNLEVVEVA
jgi:hypothetical protein